MNYDWKALSPTRPLGPGDDALYVTRVGEGAAEIDTLLEAGLDQPIGIFGPAGAGKSTELAWLAKRREERWVGPLVRLDKLLRYSDTTSVDDVLEVIAVETVRLAMRLNVPISPQLEHRVAAFFEEAKGVGPTGFDLLLAAVREITQLAPRIRQASPTGSIGLMVDGLEKASAGLAKRTLANLERLRGEALVVVVVPMGLATGPEGAALHEFHTVSIGPIVVNRALDPSADVGRQFLFDIVARRLGVRSADVGVESGDTTSLALRHAIDLSGGLVRTCLQLVQKAALYATMRGRLVPDKEDVVRAGREQTNFLLRLLKDGDVAALRAVHETNGTEIELERRVRFLANGFVLEYRTASGIVACVCPLLEDAVLNRQRAYAGV